MFEAEKGVHSTLQSMHRTINFSGEDQMKIVFAIIQFFDIIDYLNLYPIRIFTVIKLLQNKEEQGLPTPWNDLIRLILRCWGKSSMVCQQKSDAL